MNEPDYDFTRQDVISRSHAGAIAAADSTEIIFSLRNAILNGTHWYRALLEAMGYWRHPREEYDGRQFSYLIEGEAFDWLLLAERLCLAVDMIPVRERDALLFNGITPLKLNAAEVRKLIGDEKFRQYLNYFYGVTVEESLLLAVQAEVEKEKRSHGERCADSAEEAFLRIYDASREQLFNAFRHEKKYPLLKSTSLGERKEFTYWLFKYRFNKSEKARIASDTRKSLTFLRSQWQERGPFNVLFMDNGLDEARL